MKHLAGVNESRRKINLFLMVMSETERWWKRFHQDTSFTERIHLRNNLIIVRVCLWFNRSWRISEAPYWTEARAGAGSEGAGARASSCFRSGLFA